MSQGKNGDTVKETKKKREADRKYIGSVLANFAITIGCKADKNKFNRALCKAVKEIQA